MYGLTPKGGGVIAVDARWIFPEISGIGMYTQELVRHMARLSPPEEILLLFHHPEVQERVMADPDIAGSRFTGTLLPWGPFSPAGQVFMPRRLKQLGVRVYHSPNYMIPFRAFPRHRPGRIRSLVTLHDLIPLLFPDHAPRSRKARMFPLFKRLMQETALRSDILLTVSESSRRDILACFNIPPAREDRVVVIPEGVGDQYGPGTGDRAHPPEILYVGRFDPYKNVAGLIRAFAEIRKRRPEAVLRIIGPDDPRYPEPRQEAGRLRLDESIRWEGYAEDGDLVEAYRRASVMVLPSRYEGFGLTVLEAMACGTPVVCSRAASLPEVAGDAALYIDPDSPARIAEAVCRLLDDPALHRHHREKGLAQAARFRWRDTAQATLNAYRRAAEL